MSRNFRSELIVRVLYTQPSMYAYCTFMLLCFYFTGESLFRSFFPLESSPFFFLFARSLGSLGSSGTWEPLVGLRGLMVPGRSGRTIGDGARTGVVMLLAVSVVSVVTWGDMWWGGMEARSSVLQMKQLFLTSLLLTYAKSFWMLFINLWPKWHWELCDFKDLIAFLWY